MSEWVSFVKAYAETHNIPYKQALKDASPSYKTRNEKIVTPSPSVPQKIKQIQQKVIQQPQKVVDVTQEPQVTETKLKKKNVKKVAEKIFVKLQ
jgi:hypothetical protein